MNREIKFRAWDTEDKSMERVAIFLIDEYKTYPHDRGYIHNCQDWEQHDLISKPVIMQYTGLKDKNSKEIYEGDIVKEFRKSRSYPDGREYTRVIGWSNELTLDDMFGDMAAGFNLFSESLEIIGNIYENPELLTNN